MTILDMVTGLMDDFFTPFIFIVVVALAFGLLSRFLGLNKRPRRRGGGGFRRKTNVVPIKGKPDLSITNAAGQLAAVMGANFKPRPVFNKGELRLFKVLESALESESPGWRAMGQVSLGEILSSRDKGAYSAINSKRVDLLIVDEACQPLHAVEFQGTGHHLSKNTAARDAVKREALRRAGIGYVEVVSGDTPAEVREMVRKLVGRVGLD